MRTKTKGEAMNILFLLGVYPSYGGVEKVTTILANAFVERHHNVAIVSFEQPHPEVAERELDKRVTLHTLSYPVSSLTNRRKLRDIVTSGSMDILVSQWCVPYYVTRLCKQACKGTKCKIISVHHNRPDTNARIQNIENSLRQHTGAAIVNRLKLFAVKTFSRLSLRYSYDKSDRYVVLAPCFKPIAQRYMWLRDTSKMSAIYNPVTIALPQKVNTAKQKEIIYVGRIEDNQKRTQRLLEIWSLLEEAYPDWRLTIVGDGPDRGKLEQGIKDRQLKRVSIEGFQDPKVYYDRASMLLLVSEFEGFPLVIVEGMSYGVVPVVYGSYVSVYDIITDGEDGYITSMPFSAEETAKRLRHLMDNDNERRRMARNAVKASKKFVPKNIVEQWCELFKEL